MKGDRNELANPGQGFFASRRVDFRSANVCFDQQRAFLLEPRQERLTFA
jgi:hypothetical protein